MFHIICRGRNAAKYISGALDSIVIQSRDDWKATIVLDPCTDKTVRRIQKYMKMYPDRFDCIEHRHRRGLTYNYCYAVTVAHPDPDDILVFLDADDQLKRNALKVIHQVYKVRPRLLLTYGSFEFSGSHKKSRICKPYKKGAKPRKAVWAATHLKTMKAKLFAKIPKSAWQHKDKWIPAASDVAMMIPAMELAGMDRCKHIRRVLYVYENHNKKKVRRGKQLKYEAIVRAKKPLKRGKW